MVQRRNALVVLMSVSLAVLACSKAGETQATSQAAASVTSVTGATVKGGAGTAAVSASELEVVEHTVVEAARGKDDHENYWNQFQIWGEMKNKSSRTVRSITADITFYDAAGKLLAIESIGTAVKKDVRDSTPGDRVDSAVHFVAPGASVPFHYIRNLAAIKGVAATHKFTLREAVAADDGPVGVVTGLQESVGDTLNPALPESKTMAKRRTFTGALRNDGKSRCRAPKLVVAFLSADGKVKDVHSFDAVNDGNHKLVVAPGASTPVKGAVVVGFDEAWRERAPVKTFVDCERE